MKDMKKRISRYLLLAVTVILSYSCGIVSLDETTDITNVQSISIVDSFPADETLLNTALTNNSSKSWNVTGFILAGSDLFQNCRLDDTMVLNSNGSYDYDGGNQLCGSEDNIRLKSGTWEVDFGTRTLYFDKNTDNEIEVFIETCEGSTIIISTQYFGMSVLGQFEI